MRFLIQRVNNASVTVENNIVGSIDKGLLVFVGVYHDDTIAEADKLIKKLIGLRIFADSEGKTNLALADVGGQLLIVSQFTLCADCKKGNRPSFTKAAEADIANRLYEYIISECKKHVAVVEHGEFGADMKVELSNDGPFTIIFDTKDM
ncbi:MAG: D-tyrosyl-tRNA(Tyr) deacylase [Coprococcus sp.]|nr:D-tyrosyl-tRNA(Tyr) deacylase [Coprococcus sp.]